MDRNYAEKPPYPPPNPEGMSYGQQPYQNPPGYMAVPQGPQGPPGMPPQPHQAGYPPPPMGPPHGPPPQQQVHYNQQYPNTVVTGYAPPHGAPPQQVHYSQQYPNTVVVQQPMLVASQPVGPEPPSQLGCAIFVCLCCFCPTGLVAIVKAKEARSAWLAGDEAGAHAHASTTRKLIIASVVLGIIFMILGIVVRLLKNRLLTDHDDFDYDY